MRILLSFVLILLTLYTRVSAQNKETVPEVYDFLKVEGIVVDDETRLEDVTIRLFKGNSKVDSVYTGKNGHFEFVLGKDLFYSMEFEKYGYEKTVVLINTNRYQVDEENQDNSYVVGFEVELIEEIKTKNNLGLSPEDKDFFDFPRVIIGYKGGEEEGFFNDSKYLKNIKSELKKIKETAKK